MEHKKLLSLQHMSKKGSAQISNKLISVLVGLILVGALAPTIFEYANLSGSGAPSWLITLSPILVGVGIFYMLYRLTIGKK